jgi:hypothetical protein
VNVRAVVHGRDSDSVWVYDQDYVNAGVHVVPDANANANAPVYDRVNADATVDVYVDGPYRGRRLFGLRPAGRPT